MHYFILSLIFRSRFLKTPGGGRSIGCPKCQDGISEVTIDPNTDNPDEAWQRLSCKHSVKEVEPCNPATPKEKGKMPTSFATSHIIEHVEVENKTHGSLEISGKCNLNDDPVAHLKGGGRGWERVIPLKLHSQCIFNQNLIIVHMNSFNL